MRHLSQEVAGEFLSAQLLAYLDDLLQTVKIFSLSLSTQVPLCWHYTGDLEKKQCTSNFRWHFFWVNVSAKGFEKKVGCNANGFKSTKKKSSPIFLLDKVSHWQGLTRSFLLAISYNITPTAQISTFLSYTLPPRIGIISGAM